MAFMKYARAVVEHPHVSRREWGQIRTAGRSFGKVPSFARTRVKLARGSVPTNLVDQASTIFGDVFDPGQYLLTHATIVASVDVFQPQGIKLGSQLEGGFVVNRKYGDFRVEPRCAQFINNNRDAWTRGVLLKAFETFIGGHNFVEHVQIESMSKGRIIDAVARDIGDSVYIDILIATDRKHRDLVTAIENGKMGTLSMGCFLPGTQVTMADGRRIAIEDVQPGDMVLTHKGRAREVLNKQIKGGKWDMRTVHAVGLASPITSTGNHPYYVLRPAEVCACGCGESLPAYVSSAKKPTTRSLTRRFKVGHDKRVLNPNNTYSLDEFKRRKAQMDEIQNPELVKVRADELRVGDFIAFPRVKDGEHTLSVSDGKARLLGYFLAEGCFAKEKGRPVQVTFCFSMDEKSTFVAEVEGLLKQEFPDRRNEPWVQERVDSNNCMVHIRDPEVAAWFKEHGGEYSPGKRLSADAMNWSVESHKHLIGAWLNGDGHRAKAHGGFLVGTTVSLDLASQMHALMAKCGWFARFEARIGSKSVTVAEAINGGVAVRDEATGRLPAYLLTIGNTQSVELQGYCAKAPTTAKYSNQNNRTFEDWVVSPITAIEESTYEGWVHDMEVEEDHTYVAVGACVSNCTVDGTICTKCGHWAADETEMCFPTGTRILMADGKYVPIEEVVEGDLVVTHTGAIQPVLHTMGRHHDGNVTVLNVEGVPQPIRATTGHRFWVMRPETHCQCGCGQSFRRTVEHERGASQAFQRRFLPGHNSKVIPFPSGLFAPADSRNTGANLEFVPAKDIRKGDYLTFPIPQQVTASPEATEDKARLIGFFLAEGSFIKRDGVLVGVSFDFGAHEYGSLAVEVEDLLNKVWGRDERRTVDFDWRQKVASEGAKPIRRRKNSRPVPTDLTCPSCKAPSEYAYNVRFKKGQDDCYQCKVCNRQWVEGSDRAVRACRNLTGESACSVRLMCSEAAEWFHTFCGEYAHGKALAPEVMYWPQEIQKHVLFGWLGGDGTQSRLGITGNTASFDLMSQMHVLAARCGWYSRKQVTFDRRAAILDEVVNGSGPVTVRDSNGWLPSFSLTLPEPAGFGGEVRFTDPESARVTLSGVTDGFKRVGNYLLYRVREAWNECFSGQVHNIEVAKDKSYVVEGMAVHNCPHIKYQKGNTFFDEQGRQHIIAELCGHESLDPTGGVTFIEASWVETPAFTGAVLRNVMEATEETAKKAEAVLNSPPPQWSTAAMAKAAGMTKTGVGIDALERAAQQDGRVVGRVAHGPLTSPEVLSVGANPSMEADLFLSGWDEEDDEGADAPAAPPKEEGTPLEELRQEVKQHLLNEVKREIKDEMRKKDVSDRLDSTAPNDTVQHEADGLGTPSRSRQHEARAYTAGINTLVRTAASDIDLMEAVAAFNREAGVSVPVPLYRAALKVGPSTQFSGSSTSEFVRACHAALGRQPNTTEVRVMARLSHLLSRRTSARTGNHKAVATEGALT